jgi:chaperonin GroES
MSQKMTPLHDRVLVRRVAEAETVRGGIIIPDTAKEKPQEGVVVAVGTGRYEKGQTIPLAVKEGDRVLFGKYAGSEIKIDGEELLILKEDEIFGILGGSTKGAEKHEKVGAARR